MINILYFAKVREEIGLSAEQFRLPEQGCTVAELVEQLRLLHGDSGNALASVNLVVAVNQDVVEKGTSLQDGDEVAFYPPVTGG